MRISELQSESVADDTFYGTDLNDADFFAQMAASNAEIAATKHDLQALFTSASAFCKNSGLGVSDVRLPETPPRYAGGEGVSETKLGSTYRVSGGYFRSTPPRKLP